MNDPVISTSAAPESNVSLELEELRQGQQNLVLLVRVALVGLIIFSTSVFFLLNRQVHQLRVEVDKRAPMVKNAAEIIDQTQPQVMEFFNRLRAFALTNPDLLPVLAKYSLITPAAKP